MIHVLDYLAGILYTLVRTFQDMEDSSAKEPMMGSLASKSFLIGRTS